MNIAILGAGRIGSMLAYKLSSGGHDVSVVARGKRLEQLQAAGAIVPISGAPAPVKVLSAFDASVAYDVALVPVFAHQIDALMPVLCRSAARAIVPLFNTVASLAPLREAIGSERFAFGFPTFSSALVDGQLRATHIAKVQKTSLSSRRWVKFFNDAGIPAVFEPDMESFLRAHAAFVMPMMAMGCLVAKRGAGVSWAEAGTYARATDEAFAIGRAQGNRITPTMVSLLSRLPRGVYQGLLWLLSRTQTAVDLGQMGPDEPRALLQALAAMAPGSASYLLSICPASWVTGARCEPAPAPLLARSAAQRAFHASAIGGAVRRGLESLWAGAGARRVVGKGRRSQSRRERV